MLVRRYERKLIRVLSRLVREPEQARDLAQETFWRVYARLDRFDTSRRFGPWLFRVGVNLGLDWLRSNKADQPSAASIDRTNVDGKSTFELSDPDPRIQAELAQKSSLFWRRCLSRTGRSSYYAIWRASRHQKWRPSWGAVRRLSAGDFPRRESDFARSGNAARMVYEEWSKAAN